RVFNVFLLLMLSMLLLWLVPRAEATPNSTPAAQTIDAHQKISGTLTFNIDFHKTIDGLDPTVHLCSNDFTVTSSSCLETKETVANISAQFSNIPGQDDESSHTVFFNGSFDSNQSAEWSVTDDSELTRSTGCTGDFSRPTVIAHYYKRAANND